MGWASFTAILFFHSSTLMGVFNCGSFLNSSTFMCEQTSENTTLTARTIFEATSLLRLVFLLPSLFLCRYHIPPSFFFSGCLHFAFHVVQSAVTLLECMARALYVLSLLSSDIGYFCLLVGGIKQTCFLPLFDFGEKLAWILLENRIAIFVMNVLFRALDLQNDYHLTRTSNTTTILLNYPGFKADHQR
jgi:hypothetical protein